MNNSSDAPASTASSAVTLEQLCEEYHRYLIEERRLVPLTIGGYIKTAAVVLTRWCDGDPVRLGELSAADVAGFVQSGSRRGLSPRTVNEAVVHLRSLLRFLYLRGYVRTPLAQAVPWLAGSREQSLPGRSTRRSAPS